MSKPASPVVMWAAVVRNPRSEWINWLTIRRTCKEAKKAYLDNFDPGAHKRFLKNVRFARVTVSMEPQP